MARVYKNAHVVAAEIVGESAAMDRVADRILTTAKGIAAGHVRTGDYLKSLNVAKVGRRVKDRRIYSDDPDALAIEFGHMATRSDGSTYWVPGQFILIQAAEAVKRGH